jgi:hypothetical protein
MKVRLLVYIAIMGLGLMMTNMVSASVTPDLMVINPITGDTPVTGFPTVVTFRFNADVTMDVMDSGNISVLSSSFLNNAPDGAGYSFGRMSWTPSATGTFHVRLTSGATIVDSPSFTVISAGTTPGTNPPVVDMFTLPTLTTGQLTLGAGFFPSDASPSAEIDGTVVSVAGGSGSAAVTSTLLAGTHTLTVSATKAGQTGSSSVSFVVQSPGTTPTTSAAPVITDFTGIPPIVPGGDELDYTVRFVNCTELTADFADGSGVVTKTVEFSPDSQSVTFTHTYPSKNKGEHLVKFSAVNGAAVNQFILRVTVRDSDFLDFFVHRGIRPNIGRPGLVGEVSGTVPNIAMTYHIVNGPYDCWIHVHQSRAAYLNWWNEQRVLPSSSPKSLLPLSYPRSLALPDGPIVYKDDEQQ